MKEDEQPLPARAKAAFEAYPRLEPSVAFNRAVIEELERQSQRRRLTLIGRIEEFLGLDLWRFAASGLLGALFPAVLLGLLYLSNRPTKALSQTPNGPPPPYQLRGMGPFYAREWEQADGLLPPATIRQRQHDDSRTPKGSELSCVDTLSHLA